jgi:hypothetical protein
MAVEVIAYQWTAADELDSQQGPGGSGKDRHQAGDDDHSLQEAALDHGVHSE